jgi:ubiquinone/menaquinone biosynthesis C-methylase UbiE
MDEMFSGRSALSTLVAEVLKAWPAHETYVKASFAPRPPSVLDVSERLAAIVLKMAQGAAGGLPGLCADYRFLCEELVLPEEIHFRRHADYRLKSGADAYREVYSNAGVMARYMNGLLVSYVLWDPHARVVDSYVRHYLPSLPRGARHLEIGPGHGLFLYLAACERGIGTVVGWDISATSITQTRAALRTMDAPANVALHLQDILDLQDNHAGRFDSVVMSELLEHLERPDQALAAAHRLLIPSGRLWINVPVNSPAPDHIYLLRSPEEACDLVATAGFTIIDRNFFPMTGKSLDQARRQQLSISCVITATR